MAMETLRVLWPERKRRSAAQRHLCCRDGWRYNRPPPCCSPPPGLQNHPHPNRPKLWIPAASAPDLSGQRARLSPGSLPRAAPATAGFAAARFAARWLNSPRRPESRLVEQQKSRLPAPASGKWTRGRQQDMPVERGAFCDNSFTILSNSERGIPHAVRMLGRHNCCIVYATSDEILGTTSWLGGRAK